jgi:hypothetical protein
MKAVNLPLQLDLLFLLFPYHGGDRLALFRREAHQVQQAAL